jgi:tRNA modification GTPase
MSFQSDIIAAIASGHGACAIGVIRVSGAGSHRLALSLCEDINKKPEPRKLYLSWLRRPDTGERLDQALVVFYEEGASYTGEEAVEFFCHGGTLVMQSVLEALIALGARHARAGEFTKRALLNGKVDLVQAEAISLLSEARTTRARDLALQALSGKPSKEILSFHNRIVDILAEVEATLDFAEEDGVEVDIAEVTKGLESLLDEATRWVQDGIASLPLINGVKVAIVGPPNAGKSSLLNAILGRKRAIVHPEPGTTRDIITEHLVLSGIPFVFADTAGLRETSDAVEKEGVALAKQALSEAQIVVLVVDPRDTDPETVSLKLCRKPDIIVLSKADLWRDGGEVMFSTPVIKTSIYMPETIASLREHIQRLGASMFSHAKSSVLCTERQIEACSKAISAISSAILALKVGEPLEVVASMLRNAAESTAEILGLRVAEDVMERIFERFCVGK